MPRHKKRRRSATDNSTEQRRTDSSEPEGVRRCRIKLDLGEAMRFLRSNVADETFVGGGDRFKERHVGKSYRDILVAYLVKQVDVDPDDADVGWVDVEYSLCEKGKKFKSLGITAGSRVYGRGGDPFELPTRLNDLLTGKFYRNWDDSKAYHRYMLGNASISAANKSALQAFLAAPAAALASVASHYGVAVADVKTLFHRLAMNGSLQEWRGERRIPSNVQDYGLIANFEVEMRAATGEMLRDVDRRKLDGIRTQLRSLDSEKRPDLTIKSFLLQDVEFRSREAKIKVFEDLGIAHGSLEHDGLKELKTATSLDDEDMARRLTQAASAAVGLDLPVELKPPVSIDYGTTYDSINSKMFVPFEQIFSKDRNHETDLVQLKCLWKKNNRSASDEQKLEDLKESFNGPLTKYLGSFLFSQDAHVKVMSEVSDDELDDAERFERDILQRLQKELDRCRDMYRKLYLDLMNHFFCALTAMGGNTIAQLQYYAGTSRIAKCTPMTAMNLQHLFPGWTSKALGGASLSHWWLKHRERRERERIGFYPNADLVRRHPRDLNTYGGLPYDGLLPKIAGHEDEVAGLSHTYVDKERIVVDMELVQPVLDHILNVLAAGETQHYEYQLNWCAACVQLRTKLEVIMIYYGDQGAGKDLLFGDDSLFSRIYGRHHQKLNNIQNLLEKFNADSLGTMLCVLDEVTPYNKSYRNNDTLKDVISGKKIRIEPKNVNAFETDDTRNFVATTNNKNGFKFEAGERRQYIMQVSDEWTKKGSHTASERLRYFSNVLGARYEGDELARRATSDEIDAVAKEFFFFLMKRDITGFWPADYPTCEIREEQMELHDDSLDEFFELWYRNWQGSADARSYWDPRKTFYAVDILEMYRSYCYRQNMKCEYTAKQLSHELKSYGKYVAVNKRDRFGTPYQVINIGDFDGEKYEDVAEREGFDDLWKSFRDKMAPTRGYAARRGLIEDILHRQFIEDSFRDQMRVILRGKIDFVPGLQSLICNTRNQDHIRMFAFMRARAFTVEVPATASCI